MKKISAFLIVFFIALALPTTLCAQNYSDALSKAVQFFDGNKCGPNVASGNTFSWRGACHTSDGSDVGANLTGGYHDAGDHVKFGLPQGFAASVLGWALYEFKSSFDSAGVTSKMLAQLKYFTDYFIKCYVNNRFYYQIGEGESDHTYWGAPEIQTTSRPSYAYAAAGKPGTCAVSQASAALSLMYLNYRGTDATYANQCLTLARTLYNMAKADLGYSDGQSFYQSSSFYDDLSWAATWLYVIDGTASIITDVKSYLSNPTKNGDRPLVQNHWTMCWDDMGLAVLTKLGILTGDATFNTVVDENINYWINTLTKSPGGMAYLHNWGVLRYNSAASMIMLLKYRENGNAALYNFAKKQIDYILGSNPKSMSYVIGYGSNWPLHPHHRAANGYTYANGDNALPAKYLLTGALVGGPDQSDNYLDDVNQYQYTEVAIDYNASFVGALAAILGSGSTGTPVPTAVTTTAPNITPEPTTAPGCLYALGDSNGDGQINIVDALLIAQYYVGNTPATFYTCAGDVNRDGSITIVDALRVAQCYVGLISCSF